jgi:hypothetical protein
MSMTGNLDGSLAGEMESSTGTSVSRMSCHFVVTSAMLANACTTAKLVMRLNGGIDNAPMNLGKVSIIACCVICNSGSRHAIVKQMSFITGI